MLPSCRLRMFVLRLFLHTWLSFIWCFHTVAESCLHLSTAESDVVFLNLTWNPDGRAGSPLCSNTAMPTKWSWSRRWPAWTHRRSILKQNAPTNTWAPEFVAVKKVHICHSISILKNASICTIYNAIRLVLAALTHSALQLQQTSWVMYRVNADSCTVVSFFLYIYKMRENGSWDCSSLH